MKAKELSGMGEKELNSKLAELRMELIKQNAQVAVGTTPKSPGLIKQMKKNIARILTVLKNEEESKKA